MEVIKEFLGELLRERVKIAVINSMINAVMAFLVSNFLLATISPLLAFIPSAIVLAGSMYYYMRIYDLSYIEAKNRPLDEMLTTARDNAEKTNIVIVMLFQEITRKAKEISFDSLLNRWTFYGRLGLVIVLVMLTTFITPQQVSLTLSSLLESISLGTQGLAAGLKNSTDILSDGKLLDAGSRDMKLTLNPAANQINFNEEQPPSSQKFTRNEFPSDAQAVLDTLNTEKLPQDFELVKAYSLKVRGINGA